MNGSGILLQDKSSFLCSPPLRDVLLVMIRNDRQRNLFFVNRPPRGEVIIIVVPSVRFSRLRKEIDPFYTPMSYT